MLSAVVYIFNLLKQDYSAREWVKQGAPKEKLMIGMPTYGRSFTLVDKDKFDIGALASGGGTPGNFTNESGFLSYYEVQNFINNSQINNSQNIYNKLDNAQRKSFSK